MSFILNISPWTWLLLAAFCALLLIYGMYPYRFFKKLGIPGPTPLPFLGTFLGYRNGVVKFDMECFKNYGTLWGFYDGRQPVLAIMDPAIIKAILVKECYTNFTNRRAFSLLGPMKSALTTAEDEQWKRIRSVLSPTFTSGRLKEMFQIMKDYSNVLVNNMQVYVEKGEPCAMKDSIGAYSLDVIASTSFSVHIDSLNKPNDPFVMHIKKFLNPSLFNPLVIVLVFFPFIAPILERLNVNLVPKDFLNFFMNAVTSFRDKRIKGDHSGRVDFLQLMLDFRTDDPNILNSSQKGIKVILNKLVTDPVY
ncbi:cytochrome P450 3A21-like [Pelobates fuscus]|uniref:cytochrome P450 3A21-like n=1 Tax=Pelobates fuscus TaxID=191477 RepID=UPI002FE44838